MTLHLFPIKRKNQNFKIWYTHVPFSILKALLTPQKQFTEFQCIPNIDNRTWYVQKYQKLNFLNILPECLTTLGVFKNFCLAQKWKFKRHLNILTNYYNVSFCNKQTILNLVYFYIIKISDAYRWKCVYVELVCYFT